MMRHNMANQSQWRDMSGVYYVRSATATASSSFYVYVYLMQVTYSPEIGAETRLQKSGADFWKVCHEV